MNGSNLLYLLEKQGRKAKIDIKEANDYQLMAMHYYPWSLADILNHYTIASRRYT